ncbi:MAG: response regulator [Balneolaceae bacterium]
MYHLIIEFWLNLPGWIYMVLIILVCLLVLYRYINSRQGTDGPLSGNIRYLQALARYSQTADLIIDHKQVIRFANEHFLHSFLPGETKANNISFDELPLPKDLKDFILNAGEGEEYLDSDSGMKISTQPLTSGTGKHLGKLIRCDLNRKKDPDIGRITDLAHEINTPMNAISGYSELLYNEGLLSPEQLKYLKIIREQSENLKSLLNQFFTHRGGPEIFPERNKENRKIEHILIVDDVSINRTLLRVILTRSGYKIAEAANGYEAVTYFEEFSPDLILMDIRMPVMGGIEAVKRIRNSTHQKNNLPIIAVTASSVFSDQKSLHEHQFDGLLRKPFREKILLDLIASFSRADEPQAL